MDHFKLESRDVVFWMEVYQRLSEFRGCDVCVSHSSFRFSSALECRSAITVVFLAVLIEARLVLYSSLIVFRGQVTSESAGYLPFLASG